METVAVRRSVLGIAGVIVVWAIAGSVVLAHGDKPVIAAAAAFDFVVTASLVAWWLKLPRWATRATLVGGFIFAKLVAHGIVFGVIVEAAAIGSLLARNRNGFVARLVLTELRLVSMLVIGWRTPAPSISTVHRLNGWSAYAGVFAFLTCVETVPIHIVVAHWHPTLAWVISILSLYSALWVIAEALALRQGGIRRVGDALEIVIGIRHHARIPIADISIVEPCEATSLAVGEPNVYLKLCRPVVVESVFGRRRTTSAIALSVDDVVSFRNAMGMDPGDHGVRH
ncbi:MAG: hypothetical protein QM831_02860 [Kofleriaceae bacterium]